MRQFIDLMETISDDFWINTDIEVRLQHFDKDDRVLLRDGLEILFNAGSGGISIKAWVDAMKSIHSDVGVRMPGGSLLKPAEKEWKPVSTEKLREIFRIMFDTFPHLVSRAYADNYVWSAFDTSPTD